MRLNVIRMDSKGRISIPFFLRNLLELDQGDHLILKMDGKKEITATPLHREGIYNSYAAAKDSTKSKLTCFVGSK